MLPLEIILTKRSSRNAEAMNKGGRGSDGGGNRNYSCYKDTTNGSILTRSYKSAFTEAEWMGPPGSGIHEDQNSTAGLVHPKREKGLSTVSDSL